MDIKNSICVIGIGGAGINCIETNIIKNKSLLDVDVFAVDSDNQTLDKVRNSCVFPIQTGVTSLNGLSSGADLLNGRRAFKEKAVEIESILKNKKLVIIIASLTRGTGAAGIFEIINIAEKYSINIIPIIINPFDFEGPQNRFVNDLHLYIISHFNKHIFIIDNQKMMNFQNENFVNTCEKVNIIIWKFINQILNYCILNQSARIMPAMFSAAENTEDILKIEVYDKEFKNISGLVTRIRKDAALMNNYMSSFIGIIESYKKRIEKLEKGETTIETAVNKPVNFEVYSQNSTAVTIAGTFNNWEPDMYKLNSVGNDKWQIILNLPTGRYEYKFIADGDWDKLNQWNRVTVIR
ncbi:hypothetical protein KA977_14055 [Candidatus Dependentiae bacterium]|nr:hypothetical protein [Candidatus Dependentiae bacterium]